MGFDGRMVWKEGGSSRRVPRDRSGGARQQFRGEKFVAPSRTKVGFGRNKGKYVVVAPERTVNETGDAERDRGSSRAMRSTDSRTTLPSITKNPADNAVVGGVGNSNAVGDGSGFRVTAEEDEEVTGVRRLLKHAARIEDAYSYLSQLELDNNKQQQADELLALQAIYGSDYVSIDEGAAGPAVFTINVPLEIPEGIKIGYADDDDDAGEKLFTIHALPPISLLCVFPPSYPSHSAPLFELTCSWLTPTKLSTIHACLDTVWEETSPEVVVYTWSEWLRSQTLQQLGASEKLGSFVDVDVVRLLRSHNEEVHNKKFLESLHTCCICFSDFPGLGFTRLPCQHHFCKSCLRQYCNVHVKDGSVLSLTCPDVACKESVPPGLLRELLDKEAFARWDELLLQKTLNSMADVIHCPKCGTPSIEDPDHLVQCSKCRFSFCSLCMATWHPGQKCLSPEMKLRILQCRRQGRALGQETLRQERDLINECLAIDYIKREAKQCPTCSMAVQKSEGCNKMTCTNCGAYFCFQCGESIDGYDHFRNSASCVLLDQVEIDRWEMQFIQ